jgi:hypothetical protein
MASCTINDKLLKAIQSAKGTGYYYSSSFTFTTGVMVTLCTQVKLAACASPPAAPLPVAFLDS